MDVKEITDEKEKGDRLLCEPPQLLSAAVPPGTGHKVPAPCADRSVREAVYERVRYVADSRGFRILEMNGEADHLHILMETDAVTSPAELANVIKTQTARRARKLYGETLLKKYYWKPYFWSDSYFICSVSETSRQVIQQYIKNQDSEK